MTDDHDETESEESEPHAEDPAGEEPPTDADGEERTADDADDADAEDDASVEGGADEDEDADTEDDADAEADGAKADEDEDADAPVDGTEDRATPRGRFRLRGGVIAGIGAALTFLLQSYHGQLQHGSLIGFATVVMTALGILDFLGLLSLDDPDAIDWKETVFGQRDDEPIFAQPKVAGPLAAAILLIGGIGGGYEVLPYAILLSLASLIPCAIRRPGLVVFIVVAGIYFPELGVTGLWDPWETHYGEVAREIVGRNDWISLWWAQENWFWSKPILIFWSEALTMSALNVDVSPDANPMHPEWAVRLPICLLATAAVMTAYATFRKIFRPRTGVLCALVLATAPHFYMLAHQAITDMPLVSNLVMACCYLLMALSEDGKTLVRRYRFGKITLSGQHLVIFLITILSLPQLMYLITRNITMYDGFLFAWHGDEFLFGSAGNTGVPGNAPPRDVQPFMHFFWAQPIAQGLLWLSGLIGVIFMLRKERNAQTLYMFTFYVFCALAFMGKGIPGFALPGLIALMYLIASRRWELLVGGRLKVAPGALVIAICGFPWYVAMYMRHGPGFTDRLLVHDHINRLAAGVHGDKGSIEYFMEQLGFAMYPWVALLPAAVLGFMWYRRQEIDKTLSVTEQRAQYNQRETLTFVALWFFAAFTLFSAMITKFHHYIFPATPPAALLVGVLLDRLFGAPTTDATKVKRERFLGWLCMLAPLFVVLGIAGLWGDVRGIVPEGIEVADRGTWVLEHPWNPVLCVALIAAGLGGFFWGAHELHVLHRDIVLTPHQKRRRVSLGISVAAGTAIGAFVARDISWITDQRPQGYERLIQLYIYNYGRPWPDHFDYRPVYTAFAIVMISLLCLCVLSAVQRAASRGMLATTIVFCAWVLNVYFYDLSDHWGMRPLFKTYYEQRTGPEEPVIAWQMNWKGENFYTGNRVYAFVDLDNKKLREWLTEHDGESAFFMFDYARLSSFKSFMRGREVREVTNKRLSNKFLLVHIDDL